MGPRGPKFLQFQVEVKTTTCFTAKADVAPEALVFLGCCILPMSQSARAGHISESTCLVWSASKPKATTQGNSLTTCHLETSVVQPRVRGRMQNTEISSLAKVAESLECELAKLFFENFSVY